MTEQPLQTPLEESAGIPDVWRDEVQARLERYKRRRGRRIEGAFTMRFPFPPEESAAAAREEEDETPEAEQLIVSSSDDPTSRQRGDLCPSVVPPTALSGKRMLAKRFGAGGGQTARNERRLRRPRRLRRLAART